MSLEDMELFPVGVSEDLSLIFGMPEDAHRQEGKSVH
jgi:hypothetical protein